VNQASGLYSRSQQVLIAGAGYAGLPCALRLASLARRKGLEGKLRIALVNPEPRQELTCELYRTLRSGQNAFFPFVKMARRLGIQFVEGRVAGIEPGAGKLRVRGEGHGEWSYDHLVIACGRKTAPPEIEGLKELLESESAFEKRVFSFRNNAQVLALRLALQRLGWAKDATFRKDVFVVVLGAGSTGLEVAAEIAALRGRYRAARVILLDEKKSLLEGFSPIAQKMLKKDLKRMNIETVLGSKAVGMNGTEIRLENGQEIPWDLLVLCTGSRPSNTFTSPFPEAAADGGLLSSQRFEVNGHNNHWVVGDLARLPLKTQPFANAAYLPRNAQFAVQSGLYLAEHLARALGAKLPAQHEDFSPSDLGYLVSLGPNNGYARLGPQATTRLGRVISPFASGPIVDQLKKAARVRYLLRLRTAQYF
jgi:NADH dehydrogenase FAD-containing subunit